MLMFDSCHRFHGGPRALLRGGDQPATLEGAHVLPDLHEHPLGLLGHVSTGHNVAVADRRSMQLCLARHHCHRFDQGKP